MKSSFRFAVSAIALGISAFGAQAADQVNIICSVQAEWCNMIGTVYARTTGTKINITMKGSGEALAQIERQFHHLVSAVWD